jgi:shikimate kinase
MSSPDPTTNPTTTNPTTNPTVTNPTNPTNPTGTSSPTTTANPANPIATSTSSPSGHTGNIPVMILVGPPGAGKSTVGALVARRLGVGFLDTDDEVAAVARKEVGDIFVEDGEQAFRALERPVVERALRYGGVVALGSGAVLDPDVQQRLAGQRVVYLETGFAEVAKRTGLNKPRIPVPGNPRGMLRAMLEERRPVYEAVAATTVSTDELSPEEIAGQIAEAGR